MKILTLILLLFFVSHLRAQPGGGGGLKINHIFDENFREIYLNKDPISIEITLLDSTLTIVEKNKLTTPTNKLIYLPPLNNYRSNARGLMITYKNKNYRIDFENIISENGAGHIENIDSLVLFKPYILSKRNYHHPSHDGNEFKKYFLLRNLSRLYLQYGITPHTFKKLSEFDLMFDSSSFAYNRSPKIWMEDFKNLYHDYQKHNYQHDSIEIINFLSRIDTIIKKNTVIDPFVCFKIMLLNKNNEYHKIVSLFEKNPFKYPYTLYYLNTILITAYEQMKNYQKAILLNKDIAVGIKEINKEWHYVYTFNYLFLEVYYQDKNRAKALQDIIDEEKYWQYYENELKRFKILKAYNSYKFESRDKGLKEIESCDKKMIPDEIIKSMRITIQK